MAIRNQVCRLAILLAVFAFAPMVQAEDFESAWPESQERIWIGPEYWANRLQDWRISGGGLECLFMGPNRNVYLLTRELDSGDRPFLMKVHLTFTDREGLDPDKAWAGVRMAIRGEFNDYRDSAVHGKGMDVGITAGGTPFIGSPESSEGQEPMAALPMSVTLCIGVWPGEEDCDLSLVAVDPETGEDMGPELRKTLDMEALAGGLALVAHSPVRKGREPSPWIRFSGWQINGSCLTAHEERAFGPVLFAQHTLSRGILKMTAQLPPLGEKDSNTVLLQVPGQSDNTWKYVGAATIDPLARTATFRIPDWDSGKDVPYRITCSLDTSEDERTPYYFHGTIRKDPVDKDELVVAAFTGNNDLGFPNKDLVAHVERHEPDLLFFSGDQIYEGVGGYGCQRAPLDMACLDYLRKWYLYGWAYAGLMKEIPTVAIPDDHDVLHGNLWGADGKATDKEGNGADQQDSGGYKMPPDFVKVVERTQTSHLPDPFDPTPVKQGIGVYYCAMNYGGISFAVLEDRKFKSPPKVFLPAAKVWNGWSQNPDFNAAKEGDAPGAKLLGDRQLLFLRHWAQDFSHHAWMKVVLSQTIFANVATIPEEAASGAVIPKLRILHAGEYAENDRRVSDMDSNGWPQSGRNRALREMRKCFAAHIAGDQHLGSTIQYGVEDWNDGAYALCVPSVSNVWPRRWYPATPGKNQQPGAPRYTGDFEDGFGNKMTVHAVSNPLFTGMEPARLHDRATGYGIARFRRGDRTVVYENWPRGEDPSQADAAPYHGWPVVFSQGDNYGRKAFAFLPEIQVTGLMDPVIQVMDEGNGEIVYTLRIQGSEFKAKVFQDSVYSIRVSDPDKGLKQEFAGLTPLQGDEQKVLEANF